MKSKRVLEEENQEAHKRTEPLIASAAICACCGAVPAAVGLAAKPGDGAIAVPFVAVLWGAALLCLVALWRAYRTIRRWRDQERERLDVAEAERIGEEGRR